jgi:hypothetical protein
MLQGIHSDVKRHKSMGRKVAITKLKMGVMIASFSKKWVDITFYPYHGLSWEEYMWCVKLMNEYDANGKNRTTCFNKLIIVR